MSDGDVRALAADGVVVADGEVVLLERNHPPHEGAWVLPGGMVEPGERAATACEREVREEVGIDVEVRAFVSLFDEPGRDPRRNVSAAYLCEPVDADASPVACEEARAVRTAPPADLPEMGFDHADIVAAAFESL